jgi:type VI secretion system secreted protein Hcp
MTRALLLALGLALALPAAETVHLSLKINGQEVRGESSQQSMGRQDTIECLSFVSAISAPGAPGVGRARQEPLTIRKRIDRSSPLLARAVAENQVVEAVFKFFRPNPTGDGTTEQFYTITLRGSRIASIRTVVPDTTRPESSSMPPMEDVSFTVGEIVWTYTNGGVTFRVGGDAPTR